MSPDEILARHSPMAVPNRGGESADTVCRECEYGHPCRTYLSAAYGLGLDTR